MNHLDIFILLIIILVLALALDYVSLSRKRYTARLNACLQAGDYPQYCELLQTSAGKRFYKRCAGPLMQLDAAIQLELNNEVHALFDQLDQLSMTSRQYIDYNMKKLAYAIQQKDSETAAQAWNSLHKFRLGKYVTREADQLYDIYVLHQSNHIDELLDFAQKAKNPSSKAMAYFRIAKQYHYLKDADRRAQYLQLARKSYTNETWQTIIGEILEGDFSQLD